MKTKIKVIRMLGECWGEDKVDSHTYIGYLIDKNSFYNLDNEVKLFDYLVREDYFQSYLNIFDYNSGKLIATYDKSEGYMEEE